MARRTAELFPTTGSFGVAHHAVEDGFNRILPNAGGQPGVE